MSESPAQAAGRRAVRNTSFRAAAEIVGKLSTLVLLGAIARGLGQLELGILIFAFAYLGIVMTPIGFGTDPFLLREVARDRSRADDLFWNVLLFKFAVAVPVLLIGLLALGPLGYGAHARAVVAVMSIALLLDIAAKTCHSVFNAIERSELLAISIVAQRLFTAAAGVVTVVSGGGLVAVACVFAAGSAIHFALGMTFLRRSFGVPAARPRPRSWPGLTRRSAPFAVQDLFTVLLFKLDAVLLSLLVAETAVARYGAAYRLLEATMFVSYALIGAFAAMFVYLGRDTAPTLAAVFSRALKAALVLLVPVAVVFGVLAEPICVLLYGADFDDAAASLRLLSPVVVLLCLVAISTALVQSRGSRRPLLWAGGGILGINTVLNLVLIPVWEDRGAAAAMLATEVIFAGVVIRLALRDTGALPWRTMLAAPVIGGGAMALAMLALAGLGWLALPVGATVYVATVLVVERWLSPGELAMAVALVRRRSARIAGSG